MFVADPLIKVLPELKTFREVPIMPPKSKATITTRIRFFTLSPNKVDEIVYTNLEIFSK